MIALLLSALVMAGCDQRPTPTAKPEEPTEVPPAEPAPLLSELRAPGPSPEGLAWDGSHLWVLDGETRLLYQVDPSTEDVVREFPLDTKRPRDVAWDGEVLWVIDEEEGLIRLNPDTGERMLAIEGPKKDVEGEWAITGLTWDGSCLWAAISAAWCSSLKCIDPASGRVIVSVFPQCNPRGLASDGQYLWTIAYSGKEHPARLNQRILADDMTEMAQSQEFVLDLDLADPTALAYADEDLWVADRARGTIVRVPIR